MAKLSAILMITAVFTLFSSAATAGGKDYPPVACSGLTAECLIDGGGEEFLATDSAINGGVLTTTKYTSNTPYISCGALAGDSVPYARRGASYYNCRAGAEANPYGRGCSTIAHCRGGGV